MENGHSVDTGGGGGAARRGRAPPGALVGNVAPAQGVASPVFSLAFSVAVPISHGSGASSSSRVPGAWFSSSKIRKPLPPRPPTAAAAGRDGGARERGAGARCVVGRCGPAASRLDMRLSALRSFEGREDDAPPPLDIASTASSGGARMCFRMSRASNSACFCLMRPAGWARMSSPRVSTLSASSSLRFDSSTAAHEIQKRACSCPMWRAYR